MRLLTSGRMLTGTRRGNLRRVREIAKVAARHGFGHFVGRAGRRASGGGADVTAGTRGRRLRQMFEELGPTFVKFGQLLSTRPDLVPDDILQELRQLQDHVRPIPFAEVRDAIEREFGTTVGEVFPDLDEEPLAAASIGQVHVARVADGRRVVVKVQRPDAEPTLNADIALMYQLARIIRQRVSRIGFIDVVAIVDEFARTSRDELDYRIEGRNAEVVKRNFAGHSTVDVPAVLWEHTTARVLTMEAVAGTPLSHLDLEAMSGDDRKRLAHRVSETWMAMIFDHGFFHADPHPANILVQSPDHLSLVDFGMVGQLMPGDREATVRLFVDVIDQNAAKLPRRLRDIGVRYPKELEPEFREALSAIVGRYHGVTLSQLDARNLLREIFQTVHRLGITLPARWVLLDKAIATLAGVGLTISPDFNVFETARPYARRLMTSRLSPEALAARARRGAQHYAAALIDTPAQLSEILADVRDGSLRIAIDDAEARQASERAERTGNRLSLAIIGAGTLLGGIGLGAYGGGPALLGVSLVAIPGLLAGLALVGWVVAGIIRSGRW